ncbi:hypothetical protein M1D88_13130 [Arthrobacter sp. R1-13]
MLEARTFSCYSDTSASPFREPSPYGFVLAETPYCQGVGQAMLGIKTNSLGTAESAQKMKPWIHPQERRSRIYWSIQIAVGVVAMIVILILLLREPTADHVMISVAVVLIGIIALILSVRELRKLPHEYRYEEEGEDTTGQG